MSRREELRKSILLRNFERVKDPSAPQTIHDQIAMREKFTIHASVQDMPAQDKWLIKITDALLKVFPAETPSDRSLVCANAHDIFESNRDRLGPVDPEGFNLSFQPMTLSLGQPC